MGNCPQSLGENISLFLTLLALSKNALPRAAHNDLEEFCKWEEEKVGNCPQSLRENIPLFLTLLALSKNALPRAVIDSLPSPLSPA